MKFEDLKKMAGAQPVELKDEQLEQASGGFYIGSMEQCEKDGVIYRGCMGCGEAWPVNSYPATCPLCGFNWDRWNKKS